MTTDKEIRNAEIVGTGRTVSGYAVRFEEPSEYIGMIASFKAANYQDEVGPYHFGTLDQFEVYVDPNYDPAEWVMACNSNDIRRNCALFGEYMPLTDTDAIGLANASVQQGYATMYAMKVVNPDTVVCGKITGTFYSESQITFMPE